MIRLLLQWVLSAASLPIVSRLLAGFHVKNFSTAMVVAAVYGVLNVLFFNVLSFIFFLPNLLTFGLFSFVISAFLLFATDKLLDGFKIEGIFPTLIGAVILTFLNGLWRLLLF